MRYLVELAMHYKGRFAGWQEFGPFESKRAAWEFIQSKGYTASDKGEEWMVSEV